MSRDRLSADEEQRERHQSALHACRSTARQLRTNMGWAPNSGCDKTPGSKAAGNLYRFFSKELSANTIGWLDRYDHEV